MIIVIMNRAYIWGNNQKLILNHFPATLPSISCQKINPAPIYSKYYKYGQDGLANFNDNGCYKIDEMTMREVGTE